MLFNMWRLFKVNYVNTDTPPSQATSYKTKATPVPQFDGSSDMAIRHEAMNNISIDQTECKMQGSPPKPSKREFSVEDCKNALKFLEMRYRKTIANDKGDMASPVQSDSFD